VQQKNTKATNAIDEAGERRVVGRRNNSANLALSLGDAFWRGAVQVRAFTTSCPGMVNTCAGRHNGRGNVKRLSTPAAALRRKSRPFSRIVHASLGRMVMVALAHSRGFPEDRAHPNDVVGRALLACVVARGGIEQPADGHVGHFDRSSLAVSRSRTMRSYPAPLSLSCEPCSKSPALSPPSSVSASVEAPRQISVARVV